MSSPEVEEILRSGFNKMAIEIVAPPLKIYGRKALFGAFYRQARNMVPFVRYLKNLLH